MAAGIRVVLVDDHPLIRAGFRALCEGQGDIVVLAEASDGEEAVRLVGSLRPDVLVLDARLPRLDGEGVTLAVRRAAPETRILVFTAYTGDPHLARRLLDLGVHGLLGKTAGFRELAEALRQVHRGETYLDPSIARDLLDETRAASGAPTPREIEILRQVAAGKRDRDIAQALNIGETTVRFHVKNLFAKLGATNRTEMVQLARRRGWVTDQDLSRRAFTPQK